MSAYFSVGSQSQPADGESPVFTQVLTPIFNLFRKSRNRPLIDRLHGEIMAGARQPVFFVEYGVADTLEGRFEILCLVSTIALRRMSALPEPGPGIAQEVTDSLFAHFDVALREIGIGDVTVPKRMKKMASGYMGRSSAYLAGFSDHEAGRAEALPLAIARNVFGDEAQAPAAQTQRLVRYALAYAEALDDLSVDNLLIGPLPVLDAQSVS
jgi:cytochrome b pre-mRNA-processing protein 3